MGMAEIETGVTEFISEQADLDSFCAELKGVAAITVDTEFLRDKTYWPQLCLVQVAGPARAAAIDAMRGLDLAPLFELFADPSILKVFHAARQDMEIFFHLTGTLPRPIFDTQVAAMVCGYGDAASYETLAGKLAGARIDKSARFTDWSHRPLTERQLTYALADVTYLRRVHEKLAARLERTGRAHWVEDEMAVLTDPATYRLDPETAWQRLRPRSTDPKFLNVLRELAAWREREAQRRDLPRSRLLKDEALLELASQAPRNQGELARSRSLSKGVVEGTMGEALLAVISQGLAMPREAAPVIAERVEVPAGRAPLIELLKVLLKLKSEAHDVAQKLVATVADLEAIACDDEADVLALKGWRREVFGEDALALKRGDLALTAQNGAIRLVRL